MDLVTVDLWKKCVAHTIRVEDRLMALEGIPEMVDPVVITVTGSDSESDSDTDSE